MAAVQRAAKDYKDMVYNAHMTLRDYYTYEQVSYMPVKELLHQIDYFVPKLKEIEKQRQNRALEQELQGKRNMRKPGRM